MPVLLVELDLELPGARHRAGLGLRRAPPATAANPARHQQHGVGAERFGRAQRRLALGKRPLDLALVGTVELGPAVDSTEWMRIPILSATARIFAASSGVTLLGLLRPRTRRPSCASSRLRSAGR